MQTKRALKGQLEVMLWWSFPRLLVLLIFRQPDTLAAGSHKGKLTGNKSPSQVLHDDVTRFSSALSQVLVF